jgi:hypothetical protein
LRQFGPMLFFETNFENEAQLRSYQELLAWLPTLGYTCWVAFDNFGERVLKTGNVDMLHQLLDYVWRQNSGRSTRTVYYFDLLGFAECHRERADRALSDFMKS